MPDLGELKFPIAAHHRLICNAAWRDMAAMKAVLARFESVERKMVGAN